MKITFVGGGNMAAALISGLLRKGHAPGDIRVVEVLPEVRARLEREFGVACHAAVAEALDAEVLLLAVKPQQMREALASVAGRLARQLVISIAAGIRSADIKRWLGGYRRIVRTMPNTPALIGAGITGLFALPEVTDAERRQAESILAAVGETLWIDNEAMMDGVTAVSGSGPAYVFYFIEALQRAARALGFSETQARRLSLTTFLGACRLAVSGDEEVGLLRQRVTSKGGTTEAALRSLDDDLVAEAILRAVRAADTRGRELGGLLGKD